MPVTGPNSGLFNTGHFQRRTSGSSQGPQKGGPRVLIVDEPHAANYNVFFVDYPHEEENAYALQGAKIVEYPERADVALMVVDEPHLVQIHIMRENFPA